MKHLILILVMLLSFNTFSFADNPVGVFVGKICGGGNFQSDETIFYTENNVLKGLYFMNFKYTRDDDAIVVDKLLGTFSDLIYVESTRKLSGKWQDPGGSGTFDFTFDEELGSFDGVWNESTCWSGVKKI